MTIEKRRHLHSRERFWVPAIAVLTIGWLLSETRSLYAQGFLPPPTSSTQTINEGQRPVLIEQKIPETLIVTGESGKQRSLLSYKSPLEIMVVVFFSADCNVDPVFWFKLRHLTDHYEGWRVTFVAVSASSKETLTDLASTFKREKLSWPMLHDEHQKAVNLLKVASTPEFLIIDEYGILKYRGPLEHVKDALDTIISHIDNVKEPEPPLSAQGCAP